MAGNGLNYVHVNAVRSVEMMMKRCKLVRRWAVQSNRHVTVPTLPQSFQLLPSHCPCHVCSLPSCPCHHVLAQHRQHAVLVVPDHSSALALLPIFVLFFLTHIAGMTLTQHQQCTILTVHGLWCVFALLLALLGGY
jgi:hypothetical protein